MPALCSALFSAPPPASRPRPAHAAPVPLPSLASKPARLPLLAPGWSHPWPRLRPSPSPRAHKSSTTITHHQLPQPTRDTARSPPRPLALSARRSHSHPSTLPHTSTPPTPPPFVIPSPSPRARAHARRLAQHAPTHPCPRPSASASSQPSREPKLCCPRPKTPRTTRHRRGDESQPCPARPSAAHSLPTNAIVIITRRAPPAPIWLRLSPLRKPRALLRRTWRPNKGKGRLRILKIRCPH